MTPRLERARLILRSGLASYRGYLVVRNVVANLAQGVEVGSCWFDFFVFHACPLTGSKNQANTFSLFCGMVVCLVVWCFAFLHHVSRWHGMLQILCIILRMSVLR